MRIMKKIILLSMCLTMKISYSQDYFNPLFLGNDINSIDDLSYLSSENNITPGIYYLNINVGDTFIKNIRVTFGKNEDNKVSACITNEIIDIIPFNNYGKEKIKTIPKGKNNCIDLKKHMPDFSYDVDLSKLTLTLLIPQIYLETIRTTLANESDWDDGITAFISNYNLNGSFSKNKKMDNYSSLFLNLSNRFNYGAWRINSNLYYNINKSGSHTNNDLKSSSTYLSRNINSIKSSLVIGQNILGSMLFDANSIIGITLSSANEMLPDSEKGYSPSIKGIAETRSKITIKQNGNILYQEYINPGPYNIDNLNSVGTSGDYEVEITSSDGIVTKYNVPYSSLPNLLRKNSYNYAITLAKLDTYSIKKNKFSQGTVGIGLPFDSTIYTGYQISDDYLSTGVGIGKDIGQYGALSIDMIQSYAKIKNKYYNGNSYRALYAKSFNDTGTNIQLTGYRYSTSEYYTLNEANYRNNDDYSYDNQSNNDRERKKNSFQLNVSQSLGSYGQLYIWGNINSYWKSNYTSRNIQAGWNKTFPELNNIVLSASYSKNTYINNTDNIMFLSLSIPFTDNIDRGSMYLTNNISYNNSKYNNITSIYGSTLNNNLSYNLSQSLGEYNSTNKSDLNIQYKANIAEFSAGASYSNMSNEFDYGTKGSILLHQGGIIFAREANDTAILVEANGAIDARLDKSGENIRIGNNGYALIPYATPYHYNDVGIIPESFGAGYDIDGKVIKVAPTRGAISKVIFDVRKGYNFLVSLTYQGEKIKFGTLVVNNKEKINAIINDDSTVYLTGVKPNSSYTVKLDNNKSCSFIINYDENKKQMNVNKINLHCN